jgi:site-specific DNA-cytosine methylase
MKTVELFSGTGSFSQVALELGYEIRTYDLADSADELIEGSHTQCDVLDGSVDYPLRPFILWASPPCQTFSIASCSTHWTPEKEPKTEACLKGMAILHKTIELIYLYKPTWWFIENPRGLMRKKIDPILKGHGLDAIRHTVTYCQYGDTRMKPTDIFTNAFWWQPRAVCKNGDPCHVRAPRGSKTGTQGIDNARDRSRIPRELFIEIFKQLKGENQ